MDKERTRKTAKDKKKSCGAVDKSNSFINQMQLPLLCEKCGAILLVLVGLTADRLPGRQSDQILVDSKFLKVLY